MAGAPDELQQMLEIVMQETLEVQDKVAAALELRLAKRRWSWRWCTGSPALDIPVRSMRLRHLLKDLGRQGSSWQDRAAGAVSDALFRARLQALPPEITALIARRVGPVTRRASRAMLALYGPLDGTLHLTTPAMADLHLVGPSAASPTPARLAPAATLDVSALEWGLQRAALRHFPRLRCLRGCTLNSAADLVALAPLAPTLTALSLAPTRCDAPFTPVTTLTALRSLTLLHALTPPPPPPAPPAHPHVPTPPPPAAFTPQHWTDPLAALPHLRSLSLTLPPTGPLADPNAWLRPLATLSLLTSLSLAASTPTALTPRSLAHLANAWPAALSLALSLDTRPLPHLAQATLTAELTATLAASRTALTALSLSLTTSRRLALEPPDISPHHPLLTLPSLRSLALSFPSLAPPHALTLQSALAAHPPGLTRLLLCEPLLVLRPLLPTDLTPPTPSPLATISVTLSTRTHLPTALRLLATLPHLLHLRLRLAPQPHAPALAHRDDLRRHADPWTPSAPLLAALPPLHTLHIADDAAALPPSIFTAVAALPSLLTLALESSECAHDWGATSRSASSSPTAALAASFTDTPPSRHAPPHCVLSEAAARPLSALTALTSLTLAGPGFHYRASGLQALRRLPVLHSLQLQLRCPAPDDVAQRLHDGLLPLPPGLRRLTLANYAALRVPPDVRLGLRRAAARQDCCLLADAGACSLPEL